MIFSDFIQQYVQADTKLLADLHDPPEETFCLHILSLFLKMGAYRSINTVRTRIVAMLTTRKEFNSIAMIRVLPSFER